MCNYTQICFFRVIPSEVEKSHFFRVILSVAVAKSKNPISRNVQQYEANTYNIIWSAYALKDETRSTPLHSAQGDTLIFNEQPIRSVRSTFCQRGLPRLAGVDLPRPAVAGLPRLPALKQKLIKNMV